MSDKATAYYKRYAGLFYQLIACLPIWGSKYIKKKKPSIIKLQVIDVRFNPVVKSRQDFNQRPCLLGLICNHLIHALNVGSHFKLHLMPKDKLLNFTQKKLSIVISEKLFSAYTFD